MILGGHVSAAGGILKAIDRGQALEFEAIQIHPTAPQTWAKPKTTPEEGQQFAQMYPKAGIQAVFFHNIYLTNFAAESNEHWHATIGITRSYLELAAQCQAAGVVTHLGSHKGNGFTNTMDRVTEGLKRVLGEVPEESYFLIENTAGAGGTIGRSLEEVEQLVIKLKHDYPNVGVCIDTCHAFASGIPIHTEEGLEAFLQEFESRLGLENLRCIHLNDSKTEFGSNRDRHENLGDGYFTNEGFARILRHPALQQVPFIMEVPGIDGKSGPDAANRDRARSLAS